MKTTKSINQKAREWAVALSDDNVDRGVLERFNQWRSADPRHESAFQEADNLWHGLSTLDHLRCYATLPESPTSPWQRLLLKLKNLVSSIPFPITLATGLATSAILFVTLLLRSELTAIQTEHVVKEEYKTEHGEIKKHVLDDGSSITLAPKTWALVTYFNHQRHVRLLQGEIVFDVMTNPERPFVVKTENVNITVLGTVFSVKRHHQRLNIAVKKGKVRVANTVQDSLLTLNTAPTSDHAQILLPGQGLEAQLGEKIGPVKTVNSETVGAWEEGRLAYEHASLEEIIYDANNYTLNRIVIADDRLAKMRISISYRIDDLEHMLIDLEQALPIKINRDLPGTFIIESPPKKDTGPK